MPRKLKRPAEVIALRGVVVDDVEDHLDAGVVQALDGLTQSSQRCHSDRPR